MDKCPICKNYITSNRGIRGSQGVDENGDPVPFWTEDPLLTPLGLAGNNYKGRNPIRRIHIIELRRYYNEIESQLGLTPTSWVEELRVGTPVRKQHIVELRQVVERILDELGLTIADYFKYDRLGNEIGYTQTDWTDIDRSEGIPNIPKTTPIRAIHIEELRKGMSLLNRYVLLATSGYYGEGAGFAKVGKDSVLFKNYKSVIDFNYSSTDFNNVFSCFVYEKETGLLYAFDALFYSASAIPTISWIKATDIYDKSKWEGYRGGSFKTIQFDPVIEVRYPGGEGITNIAIDTAGDDYIMYTCEFFYSKIGVQPEEWGDRDCWDGIPNWISKYTYPKRRVIAISNGSASQSYLVGDSGIHIPIIEGSEIVYINGQKWIRVDNFSNSSPTDLHYTLDYNNGLLTFGDGEKGMIPPVNSAIEIFITLKDGGIWTFDSVVQQRQFNTYYWGVQADLNKHWYVKIKPAFVGGRVRSKNVVTTMYGDYTEYYGTDKYGVSHLLMKEWRSGINSSAPRYKIDVRGGFLFDNNFYTPPCQHKYIYIQDFSLAQNFINVLSDNFDSWRFTITYNGETSKPKSPKEVVGYYITAAPIMYRFDRSLPFMITYHEVIKYGDIVNGEFVENKASSLFFENSLTLSLTNAFLVQVGDQVRQVQGNEWDPFQTPQGWYRDLGGGSYVRWNYDEYATLRKNTTAKLSDSISLIFKWENDYKINKQYLALGGFLFNSYSFEVSIDQFVEL